MSSLAAARADNFYYGPEYRREHGSLNKFRGSHPLGDRAKKIGQGILVIRFEMPFKVFCTSCHEVIAKGVRFNAEKKCVGNYFSTKIFEFSMKCCFCPNILKIQTDPKNAEYKITAGLHKKVETFSADDAQTLEFRSIEERDIIEKDPMLKLETITTDRFKASTAHSQLEDLIEFQESRSAAEQYYEMNSAMRRRFRIRKAEEILEEEEAKKPKNFAVPLIPLTASDTSEAAKVRFLSNPSRLARRVKETLRLSTSIFGPKQSSSSSSSRSSLSSRRPSLAPAPPAASSPVRVPDSKHPCISLLIRPAMAVTSASAPPETPQARRLRLRGEFERLKAERRNAAIV